MGKPNKVMMLTNKLYTLIPFFLFIGIFLGTGIYLQDFYSLPAPIAILLGVLTAFILYKKPFEEKVHDFIQGCGDSKVMTMCLVYLLAGAFAVVSKQIGGVDMMVQIGLHYIPTAYMALGVFLIACFLSVSIGTSVGSIVALGPIVVGLADESGISLALLCGALLGGSMFGDNLSLISDTTIAATQSVGCAMRDKFKANFKIALPAALLTIVVLAVYGKNTTPALVDSMASFDMNFILILPYLFILVVALLGMHVFAALFLGILISGGIGLFYGDFTAIGFTKEVYNGFTSMTEIFLLSMFTGGLANMMKREGGITWVLYKMQNFMSTARSARWGIGFLAGTINFAVANNTVAILMAGTLAKDIGAKYKLSKPEVASILDIFSCIVQGILPYGAQVLILLSFTQAKLNYLELFQNLHYLGFLLLITTIYLINSSKGRKITVGN